MNANKRTIGLVALGIAIGSLPYTLFMGRANAQSSLRDMRNPQQIDSMMFGADGRIYIASGTRIYVTAPEKLKTNRWWSMVDTYGN